MPRKPLIRTGEWPYHVTARCNNRELFPCPLAEVWKFITLELFIQNSLHDLRLHAFVLMPNHFHLLLTIPSGNLDLPMKGIMESTTRIINTRAQRSGHLYGGRYYWSLINNPIYFAHAMKYVYRNPVKAGLSKSAGDYPYSTLRALYGKARPLMPLAAPRENVDFRIPRDLWEFGEWIETPYSDEESEAIRRALRRKEFAFPKNPATRRPFSIENQI